MPSVDVLVGLQWGSEGKGRVAAAIAGRYQAAVRVGGPNAGHTVWYQGKRYINRSIPCAWVNPNCALYIGAGAAIDFKILDTEITDIGIDRSRLLIDRNAVMINVNDIERESALAPISSTQHGVGAAHARKIGRQVGHAITAGQQDWTYHNQRIGDVAAGLHATSGRILVEGTQGALLAIDHGDYPYVTSRNPIAASLLGDCGLPPRAERVIGVARTYPIRVGGPSGPMGTEISWAEVARRAGLPPGLEERTTVTNKVRRVAELDYQRLAYAARLNGVTDLVVTFADYLDSSIRNRSITRINQLCVEYPAVYAVARRMADACDASLSGITWGPTAEHAVLDWL